MADRNSESTKILKALCEWYIGLLGDQQSSVGVMIHNLVEIRNLVARGKNVSTQQLSHLTLAKKYIETMTGIPYERHIEEASKNKAKGEFNG